MNQQNDLNQSQTHNTFENKENEYNKLNDHMNNVINENNAKYVR